MPIYCYIIIIIIIIIIIVIFSETKTHSIPNNRFSRFQKVRKYLHRHK
jgi:hypothetical protein